MLASVEAFKEVEKIAQSSSELAGNNRNTAKKYKKELKDCSKKKTNRMQLFAIMWRKKWEYWNPFN